MVVDVRTGRITPAAWVNREKQTLRIPLKDSVVAVMDSSYLDWLEAPEAPGELIATKSGHDVQLSWKKYGNPLGFEVQRSEDWGAWQKVTRSSAIDTHYTEPLPEAPHITYRVRALGAKDPSAWSNPAWVDLRK